MSISAQYREAHHETAAVVGNIKGLAFAAIEVLLHQELLDARGPGSNALYALLDLIEEKASKPKTSLKRSGWRWVSSDAFGLMGIRAP